jgi:hypothetical protein
MGVARQPVERSRILEKRCCAGLFGFLGRVVARPLLAAIRVLVRRLHIDRLDAEVSEGGLR